MSSRTAPIELAEITEHLSSLYATYRTAVDAKQKPDADWWKGVILMSWHEVRPVGMASWMNMSYVSRAGVTSAINVRVANETHAGNIAPLLEKDVAAANADNKNKKFEIKQRLSEKASLILRGFNKGLPKDDKGRVITTNGVLVIPPDIKKNLYYTFASLMDKVVNHECSKRVTRGERFRNAIIDGKDSEELLATTLEKFYAAHGQPTPHDMIMCNDDIMKKLRPAMNDAEAESIIPSIITVPTTKIVSMIQERSPDGQLLANPISRVSLSMDKKTGACTTAIYNKKEAYVVDGSTKFKPLLAPDGSPINQNNVHLAIVYGMGVDGLIQCGSICFSSMGMSVPATMKAMAVTPPVAYEKDDMASIYGASMPAVTIVTAPLPPTVAAPVAAPAAAAEEAVVTQSVECTFNDDEY